MGNKNRKKLLCHGLVLALVCSTAAGATVSDAAKKKAKLAKKRSEEHTSELQSQR